MAAPKSKGGRPKGSKDKAPRKRAPKAPEPDLQATAEAGVGEPAPEPRAPQAEAPKPTGDVPPGEGGGVKRTPRKRRISKAMTAQIEDALKEVLQAPAMPCAIFGDEWAANHFEEAGEVFANKVAVVSERHPVLRRWLEDSLEGESIAVLMLAALAYAGPPLIHWNLLPVPGKTLAKVPRKRRRWGRKREDAASSDGTVWSEDTQPEQAPAGMGFAERSQDEASLGGPAMAAEFSNGDGPPVYTETPAQ